jgi:Nucleotidyl transferase AbiEii toxin, Type IV TA system/Transcriptional regulator, AbiEi antitoxin
MSGNMKIRAKEPAIEIIRRMGIVRPADLEIFGITRTRLYSLVQKGLVERRGRGIYVARNHALTAEHALAQAAKLVPSGVLCMLTALRFHGLTTQSPAEVWIALQEKARKPRLDYPRLRIVRFSGAALTEGVEAHSADSIRVEAIRAEDEYAGVRAVLPARCGTARLPLQIDVGVGDSVWPVPQECIYPVLLDFPPPEVLAYPREAVVAEKLEALVVFGDRNSRIKDFFDLHFLASGFEFDRATLT